jgi:hypothetical protein
MFDKLKAKLWLRSVSRKEDLGLFWDSSSLVLERLLGKQIEAILNIIDDELIKSFGFGLKISREHVLKEKVAVLKVLNSLGSLHMMPRRFNYEEARELFLKSIYDIMEDENKFYFEKLEKKSGVKTRYNCHIEAVTFSVLNSIYNPNGKIPYI